MKQNNSTSTAVSERRRTTRQPITRSAKLFFDNDPTEGRHVCLNDISFSGIGFINSKSIEEGKTCRLTIDDQKLRLDSRIRILRCAEASDGQFTIGAEFIDGRPEPRTPRRDNQN